MLAKFFNTICMEVVLKTDAVKATLSLFLVSFMTARNPVKTTANLPAPVVLIAGAMGFTNVCVAPPPIKPGATEYAKVRSTIL
jgi:hypothetical protein